MVLEEVSLWVTEDLISKQYSWGWFLSGLLHGLIVEWNVIYCRFFELSKLLMKPFVCFFRPYPYTPSKQGFAMCANIYIYIKYTTFYNIGLSQNHVSSMNPIGAFLRPLYIDVFCTARGNLYMGLDKKNKGMAA